MTRSIDERAAAMLDAHVAHVLSTLRGDALVRFVEIEIDRALVDAERITLGEAVTRAMIKETAYAYAIELEPSGAIPELVGDIARAIYAHESQSRTRLADLLSDDAFEQFVDKALELRELREWLVHELVAQPAYAELATEVLVAGLRGVASARFGRGSRKGRGALSAAIEGLLASETVERIDDALDEALHAWVRKNLEAILVRSERFLLAHFDEERIRTIAIRVWEELRTERISRALATVSERDIEELFVLLYESWREVRRTDYYRAMIDAGIDGVFDKYGDASLRELLEELGVTRAIMRREALRFAPPIVAMLERKEMLEPLVRRHLEAFYGSPAALAILGET